MKNQSFLSMNVKEIVHYFFAYFLLDFESWASVRTWAWVLIACPFFKTFSYNSTQVDNASSQEQYK